MLSINELATVEDAGRDLLPFILDPINWVVLERLREDTTARPGENPEYQRRVGPLRICASVDVTPTLDVFVRVGFRAPGLSPMKAADHLEQFARERLPFLPNAEWQVSIDGRWIHFIRRYTSHTLEA
jgi:hypothetical protein